MTKEKKILAIQEIKDFLKGASVVYVADSKGINASVTSDFRRQAFKRDIGVKVVKNTLLRKAMEQIEEVDYSQMFDTFKGNSTLMVSQQASSPAKLIREFRKTSDKPLLKSAYLQEAFYIGDDKLEILSNIKSREEMIGEIITILKSPIRNILSALQNQSEKKEIQV